MDLAYVGVAVAYNLGRDKTCDGVRIVLGAVAPTPIRAKNSETLLEGNILTEELAAKVGDEAARESKPISDVRSSADYRRAMVGVMPQDARISPDGKVFYVADMKAEGVFLVDGDKFVEIGHIKTGLGAHGLYPSRDGTQLYVANRGVARVYGPPKGKGSVSVIDFATRKVVTSWPIPGGGSPDMGNISIDGKLLWLSGRYDDAVYVIDTTTGAVKSIPVKKEPHGLTVWPQPGRYSLGHTGNLR